ncbi:MAG: tetratricopeptide repeat protein [Hyphomicrobiales bacterium]|nr:MAG: tetratricopeptide repeat protein [Hyphomicrobiales bacterium]
MFPGVADAFPETGRLVNILQRFVVASGVALCLSAPVAAEGFLDLASPSTTGSYLAGQEAMDKLQTPDASRFFHEALLEQWENPLLLNRAFVAFAANGEIDQAADAARRLLKLGGGSNQLAQLVIATESLKQRRYAATIRDLDALGADSFEGITGAILKAWAMTGDNRVDEAFASLDEVGQGGLEEFLVFHRAIMADVAGRTDDAIEYITRAQEVDPFTADIVESYARIYGNAGRFDEALAAIAKFEAQGMTHPSVSAVKAKLVARQRPGLFADSAQAGAAEMFHSVGVAYAREGINDIALVLERLAQYLDPRNDTVTLVLGQLYDGAGQHELANALYDSIPANSLLKPMAIVRVADNLDALGDRPQALRRLSNIVATNPTDIEAISVLGDLLRTDKQYGEAAAAYTKALAVTGGKSPSDWRFYYVRGIAYERNDEFPLAEADFLRALELNPNQPQVLNYLGYSWVDKGMNLTRALDMIQKAVEAAPNDGYIIDSLGWAYYRLGRFEEAVEQLERAVQLRAADPEINDHLGDAYWRAGRKLEARFQWNVASSVDEEGNVKARVAPKLKDGLDAAPVTEDSAPIEDVPGDQASVE